MEATRSMKRVGSGNSTKLVCAGGAEDGAEGVLVVDRAEEGSWVVVLVELWVDEGSWVVVEVEEESGEAVVRVAVAVEGVVVEAVVVEGVVSSGGWVVIWWLGSEGSWEA